jgi:alcohol dehydrogenase class IV
MWFFRSPRIVFGEDSLSFLSMVETKRFLIVTDRYIASTKILGKVKTALPQGAETMVFSNIGPEPHLSEMTSDMDSIYRFKPEIIIGLGGGSSIDAAKIIYALYEKPGLSAYDITPMDNFGFGSRSKLVAIPTTSGTGSECSWAAVFSDDRENRKNEVASPEILPDYAILDPDLVMDLPREQTVNTAVDAITHAVESYVSQWNNHYSDMLAEKALSLIAPNLVKVLSDPHDEAARERVHIGASMAGLSFSNSQIGLAHALGHAMGACFNVPHGKTVGIYLPEVVRYNYLKAGQRYHVLNNLFPEKFRSDTLDMTLRNYFNEIGQPVKIGEIPISRLDYEKKLPDMVDLASQSTGILTNPEESDSKSIEELLRAVI